MTQGRVDATDEDADIVIESTGASDGDWAAAGEDVVWTVAKTLFDADMARLSGDDQAAHDGKMAIHLRDSS